MPIRKTEYTIKITESPYIIMGGLPVEFTDYLVKYSANGIVGMEHALMVLFYIHKFGARKGVLLRCADVIGKQNVEGAIGFLLESKILTKHKFIGERDLTEDEKAYEQKRFVECMQHIKKETYGE